MSNWGELRQHILTLLDVTVDASTDDDVRNAVDRETVFARDRLYNLRCPDTLLITSSAVTIDRDNEHIKITGASATDQPSFELTDYRKLHSLYVDGREWSFTDYASWLRQNSAVSGDQRWLKSYTLYRGNELILRTLPSEDQTWDVVLNYMASPATITDEGEPELEAVHHRLLVLEVVLAFPNRFVSEERLAVFATYSKERELLRKQFLQDCEALKQHTRMRPFTRRANNNTTIWGNGGV